ncbi:MAG TPA: endolytic transglycosylase MltG [Candidatus Saccharimonadales bacterium]|nr:endolytic transglycosylase MltG [Candidatus Saccharimonadales bacterium]
MNDFLPPKRPLSQQTPNQPPQVAPAQTKPVHDELLLEQPHQPLLIDKPRRSIRKVMAWILGIIILLLALAAAAATLWYQDALHPVSTDQSVAKTRIKIETGSSPSQVGQLLQENKLIRSSFAFDIYTRLSGTRLQLQAGTYSLSPAESTEQIVAHIISGKVDQFSITFLPGATLAENRSGLIKAGFKEADVDAALKKTYTHPLFQDKPAGTDLEGYIYGETYTFSADATVEQVLTKTFDEFYAKLTENNLVTGLKSQGLNLYQAITLASIVQREEPDATSQKQVAQVFYLRLAKDMPLGSDVTAYYGADQIGAERAVTVDTPYNTRIHTGLPPGPIATPGLTALQAVAAPASGDYLYFLSGDDDVTYFAHTDEEHEANIKAHCEIKCAMQ